MAKTKKLKYKQADGSLSDYIAIGADAKNIDLEEGITLEELNSQVVRYDPIKTGNLKTKNGDTIYPNTRSTSVFYEAKNQNLDVALQNLEFQFNTTAFPTASEENLGRVIQYVGETLDSHYTKGCFFKCIKGTLANGTVRYGWQRIEVSELGYLRLDEIPTENSNNPVSSHGIKTYIDTVTSNLKSLCVEWFASSDNIIDFNQIHETGIYFIHGITPSTALNCPFPFGALESTYILFVVPGGTSNDLFVSQICLCSETVDYMYGRSLYVSNGVVDEGAWISYKSDAPDIDLSDYYTKTEIDNKIGDIEAKLAAI